MRYMILAESISKAMKLKSALPFASVERASEELTRRHGCAYVVSVSAEEEVIRQLKGKVRHVYTRLPDGRLWEVSL